MEPVLDVELPLTYQELAYLEFPALSVILKLAELRETLAPPELPDTAQEIVSPDL